MQLCNRVTTLSDDETVAPMGQREGMAYVTTSMDNVRELLHWLAGVENPLQQPHLDIADCPAAWAKDPQHSYQVAKLAEHLGFIFVTYSHGGGAFVNITAHGLSAAEQAETDRRNPSVRVPKLRQLMLQWLYAQDAAGVDPEDWDAFLNDPNSQFMGQPFSNREVAGQAVHLNDTGFIEAQPIEEEATGSIHPRLTQKGHECLIEFGGDVSSHNRASRGGTTNNVYLADNKGNMAIGSENFTQSVTSGVDTSELLKFAGAVRQILPTLDLPPERAQSLDEEAAALHEEASRESPDVSLLRRLWQSVMEGLAGASQTVTGDLVTQLGQEALRSIG